VSTPVETAATSNAKFFAPQPQQASFITQPAGYANVSKSSQQDVYWGDPSFWGSSSPTRITLPAPAVKQTPFNPSPFMIPLSQQTTAQSQQMGSPVRVVQSPQMRQAPIRFYMPGPSVTSTQARPVLVVFNVYQTPRQFSAPRPAPMQIYS